MTIADTLHYGKRILVKRGPPIQLTYFVTSRCNLRCAHCFYWEALDAPHDDELNIDEIERIARSLPRLLVLSMTGGEPFVRKDLDQIHALFCEHTRPRMVTISTNGHYRERMLTQIESMLSAFPKTKLIIYLSIDGTPEINDEVRGAGTYQRTVETLDALQPFRSAKNFAVCVNMCVTARNQDVLPDVLDGLQAGGKVDNVTVGLVRGDAKDPSVKTVDIDKYRKITDLKLGFVDRGDLPYLGFALEGLLRERDRITYETVAEVAEHDHFVLPCQAGSLMGILYGNGEVFPCEILPDASIGNVRDFDYDLPALWRSDRAEELRRQIIDGKCYCTFECAMSSSILFSPKYLARSVGGALKSRVGRRPSKD